MSALPTRVPGVSIVICTRNRADSLRVTLEHLERDDRSGIDVEIVVVENGSTDPTRDVVHALSGGIPRRYLYEPTPGKGAAFNRALDEGALKEIVAVIDDDISPRPGWLRGVVSMCARWPEYDYFSGRLEVDWPTRPPPSWAVHPDVASWAFSSVPLEDGSEAPIRAGWCPPGGYVWYRRRLFDSGRRFRPIWAADPWFAFDLAESGVKGIWCADAVAGHRVQRHLLKKRVAMSRVVIWSRWLARIQLAHPSTNDFGKRLRDHPRKSRLRWTLSALRSAFGWFAACAKHYRSPDERFVALLRARGALAAATERIRRRSAIDRADGG